METAASPPSVDQQIAARLRELRAGRGWSLDELARLSTVSRASLSRLENAEVSATASVLGKLCAAYGLTLSRLMQQALDTFPALLGPEQQPVWTDPVSGFVRRSVSPPGPQLAGEVLACQLLPGTQIRYDQPPRPGLEHHLLLQEGRLSLLVNGEDHQLSPGDCLRYQLYGPSTFLAGPEGARYLVFLV